ncbi:hypothetical protein ACFFX1_02840 [Dactylosporangium sucinum]|nr:hypothetical protein [Dactylosporangium sucinum]
MNGHKERWLTASAPLGRAALSRSWRSRPGFALVSALTGELSLRSGRWRG